MNRKKLEGYKDKLLTAYSNASKPKRIAIAAVWSCSLPLLLWVPGFALLTHELGLYKPVSRSLKKCFPRLKLPDPEHILQAANDNQKHSKPDDKPKP